MAPDPLPAVLPGGPDEAWHQRMRLERELHDGPALRLSALALRLGLLSHRSQDPEIAEGISGVQDELHAVLQELRDLAGKLYPPLLDEAGLGPALRQVAEHTDAPIAIVDSEERFGPALEGATYFALAECLAALPVGAPAVEVAISREGDELVLAVTGLEPGATGRLQETARSLGGVTTVGPSSEVTVRIPCA
ncbi:histidine kinase [Actinomycetospora aeridis]|uniref:histidine kinase n=1 Tax=Actinomycetospora aeridis TaxID=3129231 RepID=A0ABU8N9D1_9PSEU